MDVVKIAVITWVEITFVSGQKSVFNGHDQSQTSLWPLCAPDLDKFPMKSLATRPWSFWSFLGLWVELKSSKTTENNHLVLFDLCWVNQFWGIYNFKWNSGWDWVVNRKKGLTLTSLWQIPWNIIFLDHSTTISWGATPDEPLKVQPHDRGLELVLSLIPSLIHLTYI